MNKLIIIIPFVLFGCSNTSTIKAQEQCQSFGFIPDTNDYKICVGRLHNSIDDYPDNIIVSERPLTEYKRTTFCERKDNFTLCEVKYHN